MNKLSLTLSWLLATPIFLTIAMVSAYKTNFAPPVYISQASTPTSNDTTLYASDLIVGKVKGLSTTVQTADARPIILAQFLEKYTSPLKPYDYFGQFLTDLADKYNMDFTLLPSIAMQESNLCKKIPEDSFNCLGLGVHSKGTWSFDSYEQNFEAAAKVLRENYLDEGLLTPQEIQKKYTPNSNGTWEEAVTFFQLKLETAEF